MRKARSAPRIDQTIRGNLAREVRGGPLSLSSPFPSNHHPQKPPTSFSQAYKSEHKIYTTLSKSSASPMDGLPPAPPPPLPLGVSSSSSSNTNDIGTGPTPPRSPPPPACDTTSSTSSSSIAPRDTLVPLILHHDSFSPSSTSTSSFPPPSTQPPLHQPPSLTSSSSSRPTSPRRRTNSDDGSRLQGPSSATSQTLETGGEDDPSMSSARGLDRWTAVRRGLAW